MAQETHKFLIECEVTLDQEVMGSWFQERIKKHGSLINFFKAEALHALNDAETLDQLCVCTELKFDGGIETGGDPLMSFKIKEDGNENDT